MIVMFWVFRGASQDRGCAHRAGDVARGRTANPNYQAHPDCNRRESSEGPNPRRGRAQIFFKLLNVLY
jgi:hypothetical protein